MGRLLDVPGRGSRPTIQICRAGLRLRLPGGQLGLAARARKDGPRKGGSLARSVGPVAVSAARQNADAVGQRHERLRLSDGFVAEIVSPSENATDAVPARSHAARSRAG